MYDVTTFGAVGDGTTDDRLSIQLAINAAQTAGGGTVLLPKKHKLGSTTSANVCLSVTGSNIFFTGYRGSSKLILGNSMDAHMINFSNGNTNCGTENLEFDGNRTNQTLGVHAIRVAGGIDRFFLRDLHIHDAAHYGVGLQIGTMKNVFMDTLFIENTGADGIDIKNDTDLNANNKMSNITVRSAGLRTDLSQQACIDLRGPWMLNNINVLDYSNRCTAGIRFRFGETTDPTGVGAHCSQLTNYFVKASSTGGTIGVQIDAKNCQVSNGYVEGAGTGYYLSQQENLLSNCYAIDCVDGFLCTDDSLPTEADRSIITGSIARSNSGHGFYVKSDNVQLNGVIARANTTKGIKIDTLANQTVLSGESQSNSGGNILNNGSNTVNVQTVGWGT